MTALKI